MVSDTFEYPRVSIGAYQTIVIFYGICLFFAFRRIGDHMTFYRNTMLSYKYNINRDFLSKIGADTNSEEFAIMDHNRQEFNKYNLFPSVKEIALESQLYKRTVKAANRAFFDHNKKSIIQSADNRRQRFSIDHKRQEHLAAKRIADWKQNQYGGENEYDVMVAEHQKRTIPEIITIINDVKNQTASM
jgi:hypothetical protein